MKSKVIIYSLFLLCFHFNLYSQTIYVDITNTSGIEDGTEQHPFNTIKEGIDAALPGNMVLIKQGSYIPDDSWSGNDHTLFLKAGVKLVGEGRENTLIEGIVVDQDSSNLAIGLEKLSFNEFHFIRGTTYGPFAEQNIIRNCATELISPSFGAGIPENDTTPGPNYGFLIENNNLTDEGVIEFKQGAGKSELSVLNNTCGYIYLKSGGGYTYLIDKNEVQYGIFDKSAANTTTISNNQISNGMISDLSGGNQFGIEDEIIENNTITATENSPAFIDEDYKAGIIVKSRSATIRNNTITCTGNVSGIRSSAGAPLNIVSNSITIDEVQQPNPDPYEGTIGILNYSGHGSVTGNKIYGGGYGYYSKAGTTEFANNEIEKSYMGFYSMGAEAVHHNIIKNCKGEGMILDGLRGPLHHNEIRNNVGSGIRILRTPIDLGGGADSSLGGNTIVGNRNFDLFIETVSAQYPTLFARNNIWDHNNASDISQFDIRDASDSTGLVVVDFIPFGINGIEASHSESEFRIFPNPTSGDAIMNWQMTDQGHVMLRVYDIVGSEIGTIVDENQIPGKHNVNFDTSGLPAGIYFCQLRVNGMTETKKMIIAK